MRATNRHPRRWARTGRRRWRRLRLPVPPPGDSTPGEPTWPLPAVRAVLDGLSEAIVATDEQGIIHYANVTAEELMGWPRGSLIGRSALELVPDAMMAPFEEGFASFVRSQADDLVGRRLEAVIKRPDGSEVQTELVLSMFDHPLAGRVVAGIFRSRDDRRLQRWSELDERAARDPGRRAHRRPSGASGCSRRSDGASTGT